ncbi:hypothetical protein DF186_25355, partial [Enterococcus hirae]
PLKKHQLKTPNSYLDRQSKTHNIKKQFFKTLPKYSITEPLSSSQKNKSDTEIKPLFSTISNRNKIIHSF